MWVSVALTFTKKVKAGGTTSPEALPASLMNDPKQKPGFPASDLEEQLSPHPSTWHPVGLQPK